MSHSIRLANHILCDPSLVAGKRVLEVGSGCGLLSVLCGQLQEKQEVDRTRGHVWATDLHPEVISRLRENVYKSQWSLECTYSLLIKDHH